MTLAATLGREHLYVLFEGLDHSCFQPFDYNNNVYLYHHHAQIELMILSSLATWHLVIAELCESTIIIAGYLRG